MKQERISSSEFTAFHTFENYRVPAELEIQTKDGDFNWLQDLPAFGLAVVGSRHPQRRSIDHLKQVISDLRPTRLIIISGFAKGVDAHAHEYALDNGLRTVAFLGCGMNLDYPKENQHLRARIIESGGAIISSFPAEAPPLPRNFHNRNGLIAGFAKAVWVVEAAEISGTLNTATWAQKFSRDLYATSCFPSDHYYQGNVKLLSEKETHRYPVAKSLFSAGSLAATWAELGSTGGFQADLLPKFAKTEIQRWVLRLQAECGECTVQNLMNYARDKGHTLGRFYLQYEKELGEGLLRQEASGRIEVLGPRLS